MWKLKGAEVASPLITMEIAMKTMHSAEARRSPTPTLTLVAGLSHVIVTRVSHVILVVSVTF